MTIQNEVSHPTAACPVPEQWTCYDSEATEIEVLKLLHSLVVALKPKVVIETGCYNGYGTEALASGCDKNGFGTVWSCDVGFDKLSITQARLQGSQLDNVKLFNCFGTELIKQVPSEIDFAFLDSGADGVRCDELRVLYPKLAKSGVVVVHDVGIQHGLRPYFFRTMKELGMEYITFDTPRGLALVRKPWSNE
jgi:predicted O-methyltransferase YrrM